MLSQRYCHLQVANQSIYNLVHVVSTRGAVFLCREHHLDNGTYGEPHGMICAPRPMTSPTPTRNVESKAWGLQGMGMTRWSTLHPRQGCYISEYTFKTVLTFNRWSSLRRNRFGLFGSCWINKFHQFSFLPWFVPKQTCSQLAFSSDPAKTQKRPHMFRHAWDTILLVIFRSISQ